MNFIKSLLLIIIGVLTVQAQRGTQVVRRESSTNNSVPARSEATVPPPILSTEDTQAALKEFEKNVASYVDPNQQKPQIDRTVLGQTSYYDITRGYKAPKSKPEEKSYEEVYNVQPKPKHYGYQKAVNHRRERGRKIYQRPNKDPKKNVPKPSYDDRFLHELCRFNSVSYADNSYDDSGDGMIEESYLFHNL